MNEKRPNLVSHGLLLAGLFSASWYVSPYQHDQNAMLLVWLVWATTGVCALSYTVKLFRF